MLATALDGNTRHAGSMELLRMSTPVLRRLTEYLPEELGSDDEMPEALVRGYMRNTSDALAAVEARGSITYH